jgi:hypothetical protein
MAEKKHVYESDVMGLPALRLVLGDVPSPDPDGRHKTGQQPKKPSRELEGTVKKLIAHLKEEER